MHHHEFPMLKNMSPNYKSWFGMCVHRATMQMNIIVFQLFQIPSERQQIHTTIIKLHEIMQNPKFPMSKAFNQHIGTPPFRIAVGMQA